MNPNKIKSLIDDLKSKDHMDLKIHELSKETITEIADCYSLHLYTPEEHPLDFYFCRGYISTSGKVITNNRNAKCSFTLSTMLYEQNKIYHDR